MKICTPRLKWFVFTQLYIYLKDVCDLHLAHCLFLSVFRQGVRCLWRQWSDGERGVSCSILGWVYLLETALHAVCVDLRQKKSSALASI